MNCTPFHLVPFGIPSTPRAALTSVRLPMVGGVPVSPPRSIPFTCLERILAVPQLTQVQTRCNLEVLATALVRSAHRGGFASWAAFDALGSVSATGLPAMERSSVGDEHVLDDTSEGAPLGSDLSTTLGEDELALRAELEEDMPFLIPRNEITTGAAIGQAPGSIDNRLVAAIQAIIQGNLCGDPTTQAVGDVLQEMLIAAAPEVPVTHPCMSVRHFSASFVSIQSNGVASLEPVISSFVDYKNAIGTAHEKVAASTWRAHASDVRMCLSSALEESSSEPPTTTTTSEPAAGVGLRIVGGHQKTSQQTRMGRYCSFGLPPHVVRLSQIPTLPLSGLVAGARNVVIVDPETTTTFTARVGMQKRICSWLLQGLRSIGTPLYDSSDAKVLVGACYPSITAAVNPDTHPGPFLGFCLQSLYYQLWAQLCEASNVQLPQDGRQDSNIELDFQLQPAASLLPEAPVEQEFDKYFTEVQSQSAHPGCLEPASIPAHICDVCAMHIINLLATRHTVAASQGCGDTFGHFLSVSLAFAELYKRAWEGSGRLSGDRRSPTAIKEWMYNMCHPVDVDGIVLQATVQAINTYPVAYITNQLGEVKNWISRKMQESALRLVDQSHWTLQKPLQRLHNPRAFEILRLPDPDADEISGAAIGDFIHVVADASWVPKVPHQTALSAIIVQCMRTSCFPLCGTVMALFRFAQRLCQTICDIPLSMATPAEAVLAHAIEVMMQHPYWHLSEASALSTAWRLAFADANMRVDRLLAKDALMDFLSGGIPRVFSTPNQRYSSQGPYNSPIATLASITAVIEILSHSVTADGLTLNDLSNVRLGYMDTETTPGILEGAIESTSNRLSQANDVLNMAARIVADARQVETLALAHNRRYVQNYEEAVVQQTKFESRWLATRSASELQRCLVQGVMNRASTSKKLLSLIQSEGKKCPELLAALHASEQLQHDTPLGPLVTHEWRPRQAASFSLWTLTEHTRYGHRTSDDIGKLGIQLAQVSYKVTEEQACGFWEWAGWCRVLPERGSMDVLHDLKERLPVQGSSQEHTEFTAQRWDQLKSALIEALLFAHYAREVVSQWYQTQQTKAAIKTLTQAPHKERVASMTPSQLSWKAS